MRQASKQNIIIVLLLMGIISLWACGYFFLNYLAHHRESYLFSFDMVHHLPFVTDFSLFYLTVFPLFMLPFLLYPSYRYFKLTAYSYMMVMIVCFFVFLFLPVTMDRPSFEVTNFSSWALGLVYYFDSPNNCFPSLHAAMSMIAALCMWRINRFIGIVSIGLALLIGISAVLVKQHYVLDILAGYIVSMTVYVLYFRRHVLKKTCSSI